MECVKYISLFDANSFKTLPEMLEYCKQQHNFDLMANARRLRLDFLGTVKLVNFIRTYIESQSALPERISAEDIDNERYLKPVLEDDAVLFSLDEVLETAGEDEKSASYIVNDAASDLERSKALEAELQSIRENFANYRLAVEQTLNRRWGVDDTPKASLGSNCKDPSGYYFESYAAHEIHETMLKDFVRTNAYRDFIYQNKQLFKDKVVLDIGCGTGILSMFCAKAGAARVIGVDKSDIIDKARENIFNNNLSDIVTCVKGNIEDMTLPVDKVDIIVSEWMGYCLLYEAMLPSVLFARDKYLRPDGILIPSSATLWIAPVRDEIYISEHISYWRDVYGFDMKAMQEGIYDEVRIDTMPKSSLCGEPFSFKVLDLYSVSPEDLSFNAEWATEMNAVPGGVDGFLIWFDTFFSPSRTASLPQAMTTPHTFSLAGPGNVAFTTGPDGPETHWKQGLLLAEPQESTQPILTLHRLVGNITFSAHSDNARALSLRIAWSTEHGENVQTWELK